MNRIIFPLIFSFVFISFISGQMAKCRDSISLSVNPYTCHAELKEIYLDNGSSEYEFLKLSDYYPTIGTHFIDLLLYKDGEVKDKCTTKVKVLKTNPTICFCCSYDFILEDEKDLELKPEFFANSFFENCFDYEISITPKFINCQTKNPSTAIIRKTYSDGNYNEYWVDIHYEVKNPKNCKEILEKTDTTPTLPENNDNMKTISEIDEIKEQLIISHTGEISKFNSNTNLKHGLYMIKTIYKSGQITFEKKFSLN